MYPINEAVGVAYYYNAFCGLILLLGFVLHSQHNPLLSYVDYKFDLNSCYLSLDPVLNTPEQVFCTNNHFKGCWERQGNTATTQEKSKATQHNSPKTVIFQRKIVCHVNPHVHCTGFSTLPSPMPSLRHYSNINIYTKNMHTTLLYIILSVVCMRESEISKSVIIGYLNLYVDLCLSINQ